MLSHRQLRAAGHCLPPAPQRQYCVLPGQTSRSPAWRWARVPGPSRAAGPTVPPRRQGGLACQSGAAKAIGMPLRQCHTGNVVFNRVACPASYSAAGVIQGRLSGCVSWRVAPSGIGTQGCALRVQKWTVGRSHDVSSSVPGLMLRFGFAAPPGI